MEPSAVDAALPARLETGRLLIRLYDPSDAEALRSLLERNREDLIESFPKTSMNWQSVDAAAAYIEGRAQLWRTRQAFWAGLWLKSSGEHVGQLQVKKIAWEIPSAELGYFIDAAHRRRGLAREAVQAAVDAFIGERGFERLSLNVIPSNLASARLAESAGFQHEGRHANAFRCGRGRLHDLLCYSKTSAKIGA